MTIGDSPPARLRHAREKAKFTRAQLAGKMALSESTIRAHENGQNAIKPEMALSYGLELGVSAAWILFGDNAEFYVDTAINVVQTRIPVRGYLKDGYHTIDGLTESLMEEIPPLDLVVPGFQSVELFAFERIYDVQARIRAFVICAPDDQSILRLGDEVVLERTVGELIERSIWRVGGAKGATVFWKGQSQSTAHAVIRVMGSGSSLGSDLTMLGIVVGHVDFKLPDSISLIEIGHVL